MKTSRWSGSFCRSKTAASNGGTAPFARDVAHLIGVGVGPGVRGDAELLFAEAAEDGAGEVVAMDVAWNGGYAAHVAKRAQQDASVEDFLDALFEVRAVGEEAVVLAWVHATLVAGFVPSPDAVL